MSLHTTLPTQPMAHTLSSPKCSQPQNPSTRHTTMEVEGWESITEELLLKVLEDGLGWAREASHAVRLVSRRWRNIHDGGCKA
jgi:hypothetical protein